MKKIIKLFIIFIFIITIGIITTIIDYNRINNDKKPVYSITNYNKNLKKEISIGIFYKFERECRNSNKEQISDSKKIVFKILGKELNIKNKLNQKEFLTITYKEKNKCTNSELLYADEKNKIYTYCLDEITVNSYGKDYEIKEYIKTKNINNLINSLRFNGLAMDKQSLELIDTNNKSSSGLKAIKCQINNNTDIYLGPNTMTYQDDFCINKDDDFEFMWTIKDNHTSNFKCPDNAEKELLYEDEENRYEFNCLMSDNIFVTTPAIRGKQELNIPIKEALITNKVNIKEAVNRGLKINIQKK